MSSQIKLKGPKRRKPKAPEIQRGMPTGREHYLSTKDMRSCTGVVALKKGEGPARKFVGRVYVSRVFWDSKTKGAYVKEAEDAEHYAELIDGLARFSGTLADEVHRAT